MPINTNSSQQAQAILANLRRLTLFLDTTFYTTFINTLQESRLDPELIFYHDGCFRYRQEVFEPKNLVHLKPMLKILFDRTTKVFAIVVRQRRNPNFNKFYADETVMFYLSNNLHQPVADLVFEQNKMTLWQEKLHQYFPELKSVPWSKISHHLSETQRQVKQQRSERPASSSLRFVDEIGSANYREIVSVHDRIISNSDRAEDPNSQENSLDSLRVLYTRLMQTWADNHLKSLTNNEKKLSPLAQNLKLILHTEQSMKGVNSAEAKVLLSNATSAPAVVVDQVRPAKLATEIYPVVPASTFDEQAEADSAIRIALPFRLSNSIEYLALITIAAYTSAYHELLQDAPFLAGHLQTKNEVCCQYLGKARCQKIAVGRAATKMIYDKVKTVLELILACDRTLKNSQMLDEAQLRVLMKVILKPAHSGLFETTLGVASWYKRLFMHLKPVGAIQRHVLYLYKRTAKWDMAVGNLAHLHIKRPVRPNINLKFTTLNTLLLNDKNTISWQKGLSCASEAFSGLYKNYITSWAQDFISHFIGQAPITASVMLSQDRQYPHTSTQDSRSYQTRMDDFGKMPALDTLYSPRSINRPISTAQAPTDDVFSPKPPKKRVRL